MNATTYTSVLNTLLLGEMAAVETYSQVLNKFGDPKVMAELRTVIDEHRDAARALRDEVIRSGGTLPDGSNVWASTEAAKALGPTTVLAALRHGEEHEIEEYEFALGNNSLHPDCQKLIRSQLIPSCKIHVEKLNALLGGQSPGIHSPRNSQ